jgi:glycosyltransferase involved in cell wall biosynthesis
MKISIITPSYNQGVFIERTLQSVAMQRDALPDGVELEHVVFDGGSTDSTVDVLKRFSPPVRWVSEKDRGQTDAVNKGIRATDGEIVGWLNSDDIYYDGALASVLAYFDAHPDVDMVYGMADHIDQQDHAFEAYPTEPWDFERMIQTCFICQPALFFRRRVFERYGLLNESLHYCMDYEYWLRLGKAGARFAYLEQKLAGSRLYADNKTLGARVKVHAEINDMFKAKFGRVPRRWIANYAHAVVENKIVRARQPRRFLFMLMLWSQWAAFHWNREVFR